MKKRIRLGISSMSNCVKYISQPRRSAQSSISSISAQDAHLSDLSSSDLDDMFANNLRLLQDLEKKETDESSNTDGKYFQSSLNIYISPHAKETKNHQIVQSNCDIIPVFDKRWRSSQTSEKNDKDKSKTSSLSRSKVYSSYEVLYDTLLHNDQEDGKERDWECMSQSMIESPKRHPSKFGSIHSTDSDVTLKSSPSSNDSSSDSLKGSKIKALEISRSNQSLLMSNEIHMNTKLRPHQNGMLTRPTSCYMSDSVAYNCSNKPPSYPSSITNENRILRTSLDAPSNLIVSRSLKTLSLTPQSDLGRTVACSNNLDFYRNIDQNSNLSISPCNNIMNNRIQNYPRCSSNQSLSNHDKRKVSVSPPVVPPRRKSLLSTAKVLNDDRQRNGVSSEKVHQNTKKSLVDAKEVHVKPSKQTERKSQRKTQNYDNEFQYPLSQTNSLSSCTIYEIRRKSQK